MRLLNPDEVWFNQNTLTCKVLTSTSSFFKCLGLIGAPHSTKRTAAFFLSFHVFLSFFFLSFYQTVLSNMSKIWTKHNCHLLVYWMMCEPCKPQFSLNITEEDLPVFTTCFLWQHLGVAQQIAVMKTQPISQCLCFPGVQECGTGLKKCL